MGILKDIFKITKTFSLVPETNLFETGDLVVVNNLYNSYNPIIDTSIMQVVSINRPTLIGSKYYDMHVRIIGTVKSNILINDPDLYPVHSKYFKLYKGESMNLQEAYLKMQENCGIEIGDTVKVLRAAKDQELGWNNCWLPDKNHAVGKEFTVIAIGKHGITLNTRAAGSSINFDFPFFVLEKIKNAEPIDEILAYVKNTDWACPNISEKVYTLAEMLIKRIRKG